jgi:hypothetical protein
MTEKCPNKSFMIFDVNFFLNSLQGNNARDCLELVHTVNVDALRLNLLMHAAPEADPLDERMPRFARFQFLEVSMATAHTPCELYAFGRHDDKYVV